MSQINSPSSRIHELTSDLQHSRKMPHTKRQPIFFRVVKDGEKSLMLLRQMKACFISSILSCNEVMTLQPDDSPNGSNEVDSQTPGETVLDDNQLVSDKIGKLREEVSEMEKSLKVCGETLVSIKRNLEKALETAHELKNCFYDSAILLCQSVNVINHTDFSNNQQIITKIMGNFVKGLDLLRQLTPCMSSIDSSTNSLLESAPSSSSASRNDLHLRIAQQLEGFSVISQLKKISNIEVPKIVMSLNRYRQEVFPQFNQKCSNALILIRELKNNVKTLIDYCERNAQKFPIHSNDGGCSNQQDKNISEPNSNPVEDDIQVIYSKTNSNNRENPVNEKCEILRPRTLVKRKLEQDGESDDTDSSDSDWSEYRRQRNKFEYTEECKMVELVREKKAYNHASSIIFWRKMKEDGHFERHTESSLVAKWKFSIISRLHLLISDEDKRKDFEANLNGAKIKKEKKKKSFRHTR